VATDQQLTTIDRRDYKGSEGLFIGAVRHRSLAIAVSPKEFAIAVWNRSSSRTVRDSSSPQEFITISSSRKLHRSGLRQLGADEEPEEVAGSCDVIGPVISDCKHRLMYIQ
jgi:hypothetical protein